MIFFRARPIGGELRAGDDASEARVFRIDELPTLPFRTHREAMAQYLRERAHEDNQPPAIPRDHDEEGADFIIRPVEATDIDEMMALLHLIPANRELTRDQWRDVMLRLREGNGVEVFVAQARQQPARRCAATWARCG